jgi:hypothetical protein
MKYGKGTSGFAIQFAAAKRSNQPKESYGSFGKKN